MKQVVISISIFLGGVAFAWIATPQLTGHQKQAFKECLLELQNKCSSLISYASDLEKENSRLNKSCSVDPIIFQDKKNGEFDASF